MRFAMFCLALLGLGLAGLLTHWMALACLVILAYRPVLNLGWTAFLPLIPIMIHPEVEGDSIMYNLPLALRTLYYHSINLAVDNSISQWMHQAELILCIAPEYGRVINGLAIAGCAVLLWDMLVRAGVGRLAWMAPVIVLTAHSTYHIAGSSKMDAWTMFFSFLSAWYFMRGRIFHSGLAVGLAAACKLTAGPLALGLLIFGGSRMAVAAGAGLVLVPWMVREYLVVGNPIFPAMGNAFTETFWPALRKRQYAEEVSRGKNLGTMITTLFLMSPASAFCVSGASQARMRRMVFIGVIGAVGVFWNMTLNPRYLLPVLPWLAVPSMVAVHRWLYGPALCGAYAFLAVFCTVGGYIKAVNQDPIPKTYLAAMEACEGKRVLSWGEERKYPKGSPRNVMWSYLGQPLMWKLAKESTGSSRMVVKARQMGVTHILVNPYSLKTQEIFSGPFLWRQTQAQRYFDFVIRYLFPVWISAADTAGAYILYSIGGKP